MRRFHRLVHPLFWGPPGEPNGGEPAGQKALGRERRRAYAGEQPGFRGAMSQPSRSLSLPNLRASPLRTGRSPALIPTAVGLLGILALSGVYLGIVSLAESPRHALDLFWEDRWLVVPILLTFGVQLGLFTFVRTCPRRRPALPPRPAAAFRRSP